MHINTFLSKKTTSERISNYIRGVKTLKSESRVYWFLVLYTSSLVCLISVGGSMRALLTYL